MKSLAVSMNACGDTVGAVAYPEYLTNDSRLTLANVRSAAAIASQRPRW